MGEVCVAVVDVVVRNEAVCHDLEIIEHGHASGLAGRVVDEELSVVEEQVLERSLHCSDVVTVDCCLLGVHVGAGLGHLHSTCGGNVCQRLVGQCLLQGHHKS